MWSRKTQFGIEQFLEVIANSIMWPEIIVDCMSKVQMGAQLCLRHLDNFQMYEENQPDVYMAVIADGNFAGI